MHNCCLIIACSSVLSQIPCRTPSAPLVFTRLIWSQVRLLKLHGSSATGRELLSREQRQPPTGPVLASFAGAVAGGRTRHSPERQMRRAADRPPVDPIRYADDGTPAPLLTFAAPTPTPNDHDHHNGSGGQLAGDSRRQSAAHYTPSPFLNSPSAFSSRVKGKVVRTPVPSPDHNHSNDSGSPQGQGGAPGARPPVKQVGCSVCTLISLFVGDHVGCVVRT